ncbi:MAG: FecR family protein [Pseudomonadota bacterium]
MLLSAYGDVRAVDADGVERPLRRRAAVNSGDVLKTASGATAQVKFTDGGIVALKPGTRLKIDQYRYRSNEGGNTSIMSLLQGGFRTVSGALARADRSAYKVNTPVATIGIRGTFYEADYSDADGLRFGVWDGGIQVCNNHGCMDLGLDSQYRFGWVPAGGSGAPQGAAEPPPGIGGGGAPPDAGNAGAGSSSDLAFVDAGNGGASLPGNPGNDGEPEDTGSLIGGDQQTPTDVLDPSLDDVHVVTPRFRSYLFYAHDAAQADLGWVAPGGTRLLSGEGDIGYGTDPISGSTFINGPWKFQSPADGGILIQEQGCSCSTFAQTFADGASMFWGYWTTAGAAHPVSATPVSLVGEGAFVMGDVAPLSVVQGMSTTLYTGSVNYPLVIDSTDSTVKSPSLSIALDFATATASGSLSASGTGGGVWSIGLAGNISGSGLNMTADSQNSSYSNTSLSFASAVTGTLDATLVGKTTVDALMGSFGFQTVDPLPPGTVPATLEGVFTATLSPSAP